MLGFSQSFSVIERCLVPRPAQVPDTCPPVCGIDASHAAILHEWSGERTLPPCPDKSVFATSRQRSAYGSPGLNVQARQLFQALAVRGGASGTEHQAASQDALAPSNARAQR